MAVIDTIRAAEWCYLVMNMKCLKWLNLLPFIMFFIVDKLRGTLISRYLLITIVALGVMNMCLAKGMKEYIFFSLMLVASTIVGMIFYTYYYYYFVCAVFETPIVGAFVMMVYGIIREKVYENMIGVICDAMADVCSKRS